MVVYFTTTPTIFTTLRVTSTEYKCSCTGEAMSGQAPQLKYHDTEHYHLGGKKHEGRGNRVNSSRQLVVPSLETTTTYEVATESSGHHQPSFAIIKPETSFQTVESPQPLSTDQAGKAPTPLHEAPKPDSKVKSTPSKILKRDLSLQFVGTYDIMTPEEFVYYQNQQEEHNRADQQNQIDLTDEVFGQPREEGFEIHTQGVNIYE
jgi:hypothetical protein